MRIEKIIDEIVNSENNFEESIGNFDILTEKMDDNFTPYRIEQSVMMWINEEGVLGEIECIFPEQVNDEITLISSKIVREQNGFPIININEKISFSCNEVLVFAGDDYFVLYFTNTKVYDVKIISQNLVFYLFNSELIAIKAMVLGNKL
ncbi:hypothetical protein JZO78_15155 [Enterococcus ureilyticus]|uniref:hypothetical protein n=1 Tax=Enterococcus ureilyticus TaxID=1131292 RepID=UPI001A91DC30|nr:hypothetical protein [Enterococcus ureilyticus]MBO0447669.1 hypothetical protein [Enterococcus ureilyticus]